MTKICVSKGKRGEREGGGRGEGEREREEKEKKEKVKIMYTHTHTHAQRTACEHFCSMSFIRSPKVLSLLSANVDMQYEAFSPLITKNRNTWLKRDTQKGQNLLAAISSTLINSYVHFASKKSLNAKWSSNSPPGGRGGPKLGILSAE